MERRPELDPVPPSLGTQVGAWLLKAWSGRGSYGTVYRAVRVGREREGPVALKLASSPQDPRFGREAELLSRIHHPHVPRLLAQGHWRHASGASYPYLVMEWVDGDPLYEWASMYHLTSRHALRLLAQVARALEATHAVGGVHRDVKGDNILVQPATLRALLMDLGAGTWAGAAPLTETLMPSGTRLYRPPEALRFQWAHRGSHSVYYEATPADDIYALGVTAYRLVTGVYPPPGTEPEAREDSRRATTPIRWPAQALNTRVVPVLSDLIERMLAEAPEARGSAREVAAALEEAAESAGPEADVPLGNAGWAPAGVFPVEVPVAPAPGPVQAPVPAVSAQAPRPWRLPLLVGAVVGVLLTVGLWPREPVRSAPPVVWVEAEETELDAGTVGLAHAAVAISRSPEQSSSDWEGIALDMPQHPLPGQLRPDANGRCHTKGQVAINGGCWLRIALDADDCEEDGYVYRDKCYVAVFLPSRPPTSGSLRDAGAD